MEKKKVTRLRLLIAAVMALFLSPREAFADLDGSQFHKSYNYQINLSGTNTVKLRFPCGGGGDHHEFSFKHKSVLNYTVQGQSSRQLMELHSKCGTKDDPKQEGNLQAALASENSAKLEYESNRNLFDKNIVSRYMLDNSENSYKRVLGGSRLQRTEYGQIESICDFFAFFYATMFGYVEKKHYLCTLID